MVEDKSKYIDKAIEELKTKSVISLKAITEDYEDPKVFTSTSSDLEVQPDISYQGNFGGKHFVDVVLKSVNTQNLVIRWKLLSLKASLKKGKLHLLAPKGHLMFAQKLVNKHRINALIHSL